MKMTKMSVKFICLSIVMLTQINIGWSMEETEPLLKLVLSSKNHTLKKGAIRHQILPNLASLNLREIRDQQTREFQNGAYEFDRNLDVGFLAIINLSSTVLKVLHYKVQPGAFSIFPRGYGKHENTERIPLLKESTKFIKLFGCQDQSGADIYDISSEIVNRYSPDFFNIIVFGEYDDEGRLSVVEDILEKYKSSPLKKGKCFLEERTQREPEFSSYLQDPESFSKSLRNTNLIFFYEEIVLVSD